MRIERYKVDVDNITLDRKELERLRDHYAGMSRNNGDDVTVQEMLILGRHSMLVDILKLFEK